MDLYKELDDDQLSELTHLAHALAHGALPVELALEDFETIGTLSPAVRAIFEQLKGAIEAERGSSSGGDRRATLVRVVERIRRDHPEAARALFIALSAEDEVRRTPRSRA